MFSWDKPEDRVAIAQMNTELQRAQLELLSAHLATHQLRLRYSPEDLARFGDRDVLRKALQAAKALGEYYGSIEKRMEAEPHAEPSRPTEERIAEAVTQVASYLREQRDHYFASAAPLSNRQKALMWPYFSAALLDRVRVAELKGSRICNPPFYEECRALGFTNLPDLTQTPSVTFIDVVVFNDAFTDRQLFHGLVHAAQFELLGLERYTDLFVRGLLHTKAPSTVPLEAQAFALVSKFAAAPASRFSVEEQVRLWIKQARY